VADVPGVAEPAVEETAVEDDAPADTVETTIAT